MSDSDLTFTQDRVGYHIYLDGKKFKLKLRLTIWPTGYPDLCHIEESDSLNMSGELWVNSVGKDLKLGVTPGDFSIGSNDVGNLGSIGHFVKSKTVPNLFEEIELATWKIEPILRKI